MKGNMQDPFTLLILFMVFCFVVILMYYIVDRFGTKAGSKIDQTPITDVKNAYAQFDDLYIFIVVLSFLSVVASAYNVRTEPVYFVFSFFIFLLIFVFGAIFLNVFDDIFTSTAFGSTYNLFSTMKYVNQHMLEIVLFFGVIIMVVLYGKPTGGDTRFGV